MMAFYRKGRYWPEPIIRKSIQGACPSTEDDDYGNDDHDNVKGGTGLNNTENLGRLHNGTQVSNK